MGKRTIHNIEDVYHKVVSKQRIQFIIEYLENVIGEEGSYLYLYSGVNPVLDQDFYLDLERHELEASFLEEYKKYLNGEQFIYYHGSTIPEEFKRQMPQNTATALWYPIVANEQCRGFVCVGNKKDIEFSQKQLNHLAILLEMMSFFFSAHFLQEQVSGNITELGSMLDKLGTYLYTIDAKAHEIQYCSPGLQEKFGAKAKPGTKCNDAFCGELGAEDFCPIKGLDESGKPVTSEFYISKIDAWIKATAQYYQNGDKQQILIALSDISDARQKENAIEKVAYRDQLLHIHNRLAFTRKLDALVAARQGNVFALLVDIEDFRQLNDLFGFETGNSLLKAIVKELYELGISEQTYRYSGGQFCILLDDGDVLQAVTLVRSLLERFENGVTVGDKTINININTAIVSNEEGEFTVNNFVSKLNCALEEVKNNSSNFLILGKPMEDRMKRTNQVKQIIKDMLDEHTIIVVYQPIYDIIQNRFRKAEALARIYDNDLGWISPAEFIPLAEKMGKIHELDMIVLEKVCQQINEMKKKHVQFSCVHVNVSAAQLVEKDFVEQVIDLIDSYHIDHSEIELEITETTLFSSLELGENIIRRFKAEGIHAALDDFGSGYSSLDYVVNLPFQTLKINMSLIERIVESEKYRKMVKYIIEIAKDFQMETIAEGVETFDQYCILKEMGCDNIQGYYFAKPMLKDEIMKKHAKNPNYKGASVFQEAKEVQKSNQ